MQGKVEAEGWEGPYFLWLIGGMGVLTVGLCCKDNGTFVAQNWADAEIRARRKKRDGE